MIAPVWSRIREYFPTVDAASKLLWLAIRNIHADAIRTAHGWHAAVNQFAIFFGNRFTNRRRR